AHRRHHEPLRLVAGAPRMGGPLRRRQGAGRGHPPAHPR
ncbi:MAG: hypothetical protein AVDCRST_MAG15-2360, partial [uncultured Rubellimicrobium sp.]